MLYLIFSGNKLNPARRSNPQEQFIKINKKNTGQREFQLEQDSVILCLLHKIIESEQEFSQEDFKALESIKNFLNNKSGQAIAPISNAQYGALLVYESDSQLQIFSGTNIDPLRKEDLMIPELRNCAETQAAIAAKHSGLHDTDLVLMFLYRGPESGRFFAAEKLLPCKDCNKKYISNLISNRGSLILLIDDNSPRNFLSPNYPDQKSSKIISLNSNNSTINLIAFDAAKMIFLNSENSLGARVCNKPKTSF